MRKTLILVFAALVIALWSYAVAIPPPPPSAGDIESVGDCTSGAALDGSSDGGTIISLYDGDSNKTAISAGNSSVDLSFTLPTSFPPNDGDLVIMGLTGALGYTPQSTFAVAAHDHAGIYQDADADLTTYAGITPSADVQTLLGSANFAAARTNLGVGIGSDVQAYDLDLDSLASGITGIAKGLGDGSGYTAASASDYASTVNTGTFAAPTTTDPYSVTNAYNAILWYGATGEIDLPAAVAGMNLVIYNTGAFTITIDPNGTDVIVRDGTAQAAGVSFTLSSGAGNYVTLVSDTANHWVTLGYKGALAQGS